MSTGGRNTKWIVLAMGIVVAVGAISYFGGWYPPTTDESTGAIGAAKRFRAEQMTDRDVVLEDSQVAAFMQTDTFDRIMKNDAARKLLASPEFQAAMQNDTMTGLLGKARTRQILQDAGLVALVESLGNAGLKNRMEAELVATVVEAAGKTRIQESLGEASAQGRRQLVVNAAMTNISEAEGKGRLSLLNDAEFRKALVLVQGEAGSGAIHTEAEARRNSPVTDAGMAAKVQDAMTDAAGRGGRNSLVVDSLSKVGRMNDAWGRELTTNPELRAVVLAGLESNAFAQFDEAAARQNNRKLVDAASKVFLDTLSHQKYDRLMADGAAIQKVYDAGAGGHGSLVVELAAVAQNDAQWGALFNDTGARNGGPIVRDAEALSNISLLYDLAQRGGGRQILLDAAALAQMDAAGHGAVLDALQANPNARRIYTDGAVVKQVRGEVD